MPSTIPVPRTPRGYRKKYNMEFCIKGKDNLKFEDVEMSEIIKNYNTLCNEHFNLDLKVTNQVVYNLHKRPEKVKNIIKDILKVQVIPFEKQHYIPRDPSGIKRKYTKKVKVNTLLTSGNTENKENKENKETTLLTTGNTET